MPRNIRNSIKTSYLHIMTQGVNKNYIFNKEEDIKFYIKIMYKILCDYNIRIVAYCIMSNHTHMLVEVKDIQEISKYMHRLNTTYSKYYNNKYDRVGHVFRDRYKSEAIYDERYLWTCVRYIFDNPVKAGICNKPEEYKWSNYKPIPMKVAEEYLFIDIEEDIERVQKEFIVKFLKEKNVEITNWKQNKATFKELVNILYIKYKMSFKKISEELNISKDTVRRFCID